MKLRSHHPNDRQHSTLVLTIELWNHINNKDEKINLYHCAIGALHISLH